MLIATFINLKDWFGETPIRYTRNDINSQNQPFFSSFFSHNHNMFNKHKTV